MSALQLPGLPSSWAAPGVWGKVYFNEGPSSAAIGVREICIVAPKTAAGTWTVNTRYQVRTAAEAEEGGGPGSMLHRAYLTLAGNNSDAPIYVVPYAATSVSTNVAAAGTITWTGTATGDGIAWVEACGERFEHAFEDGDDVTSIAVAQKALLNAATHLPFTTDNASGVLTATAKIDGVSQGDGTTGVIRYRAGVTAGKGITVATSGAALGLGTGTAGVDGTTTEVANLTAALATLDADHKYYIGYTAWIAAAQTAVAAHLATKATAKVGMPSTSVGAFTGTQAAGAALATAQNFERMRICVQPNSEWDVAAIVGNALAVFQKYEALDPAFNFNGYNGRDKISGYELGRDWKVPACYATSDRPDADDENDAILDGLTLIGSSDGGSRIVHSATTRSKNGANNDSRSRSSHTVSAADHFMATLLSVLTNAARGKKLKADLRLANGKIDANQPLGKNVVTPGTLAPLIRQVARDEETAGIIDSADEVATSLIAQIDPDNNSRVEFGLDFKSIALLGQIVVRAAENTPG